MDISDATVNLAIGLLGGITGGIVTGIYTLKATDKAIRAESEKEQRRDEQEIDNLLDALGVELDALWTFHMRRIGEHVEQLADGQPLEFYYPLTQNYFTIYDATAPLMGRIKDCELSKAIVVCYNKCKKVVDGFKYNNELYKHYLDLTDQDTPAPKLATARQALADFAAIIKEDHFELKGYVERLLAMLAVRDN